MRYYKFAHEGAAVKKAPPAKVFTSVDEAESVYRAYSEFCNGRGFSPHNACGGKILLVGADTKAALKRFDVSQFRLEAGVKIERVFS